MIDDEQPQALNLFDAIQGDSYTETISNILDMSQGNEVFRDLLLRGFYQNPRREIHHKVNSAIDKLINAGKKFNWKCEHNGCNKLSAYSHELSERAALSPLADDENKAFILKRNLRSNSFEYSFDRKHIRDILNFSGYCSEHDQSLFKLLDQPGREIDLEYVNLQALKMLRRHILNYEIHIKLYRDMASEIHSLISESIEAEYDITSLQECFDNTQQKINDWEDLSKASRAFYDTLWAGIQSGDYVVDYVKLPCYKLGWAFSQTVELICEESDECALSFIFKIDINGQPLLIHAWDKKTFTSTHKELHISLDDIIKQILINKGKLAFSLSFLMSIDQMHLHYLLMDEEIYNNTENPLFRLLFKRIFFNEPEGDSA